MSGGRIVWRAASQLTTSVAYGVTEDRKLRAQKLMSERGMSAAGPSRVFGVQSIDGGVGRWRVDWATGGTGEPRAGREFQEAVFRDRLRLQCSGSGHIIWASSEYDPAYLQPFFLHVAWLSSPVSGLPYLALYELTSTAASPTTLCRDVWPEGKGRLMKDTSTLETLPRYRVVPDSHDELSDWLCVDPCGGDSGSTVFIHPDCAEVDGVQELTLRLEGFVEDISVGMMGTWNG